jgi:hypothetical protein
MNFVVDGEWFCIALLAKTGRDLKRHSSIFHDGGNSTGHRMTFLVGMIPCVFAPLIPSPEQRSFKNRRPARADWRSGVAAQNSLQRLTYFLAIFAATAPLV